MNLKHYMIRFVLRIFLSHTVVISNALTVSPHVSEHGITFPWMLQTDTGMAWHLFSLKNMFVENETCTFGF